MMGIWVIAGILAGMALLGIAYSLFWAVGDFVCPFTHRQVPLGEVHSHILAMFRRGLNRSEMLIACEQNGKELRFRKTYKHGQPGIAFHLIVPMLDPTEPGISEAIASIEALGLECRIGRRKRCLLTMDIDCLGVVERANAAADIVLASIVRAPTTATFCVRVKGGFLHMDGCISGETEPGQIVAMYRWAAEKGDEARPYTWVSYYCSRGTLARSLGAAVGRIAARLFGPPR